MLQVLPLQMYWSCWSTFHSSYTTIYYKGYGYPFFITMHHTQQSTTNGKLTSYTLTYNLHKNLLQGVGSPFIQEQTPYTTIYYRCIVTFYTLTYTIHNNMPQVYCNLLHIDIHHTKQCITRGMVTLYTFT